jgi:hypothetical protein
VLRTATFIGCCVLAGSCGGNPQRSGSEPGAGDRAAAVDADTELACSRTRSAGAWTQLVFQTATWRHLADRADRRDPDAWTAIGDLIEQRLRNVPGTACTEAMLRDVRASAGRLAPPR